MVSVANIIAELSHMVVWVHTQIGCGLDPDACARHQYESLRAKIQSLTGIDIEQATQLVDAIRGHSLEQWTATQVQELCVAVGSKTGVLDSLDKRKQEVLAFPKFMTKSEIDSLKGGMLSEKAMIRVVVERAQKLGMHSPSETAKGNIAAVVATVMGIDTGTPAWMTLLGKVKKGLAAIKPSAWKHRTIWLYNDPSDIVAEPWYAAAYGTEGPSGDTWETEEPEVLRSSHNRLRTKTSVEPKAAIPAVMPSVEIGAYQAMFGQSMAAAIFSGMQAAAASAPGQYGGCTPQGSATASQWSPAAGLVPRPKACMPPAPGTASTAALEAASPQEVGAVLKATMPVAPASASTAAVQDGAHDGADAAADAHDMSEEEEALRKAIAKRAVLKKPGKKTESDDEGDCDADHVARKRPAGADGAPMKAAKAARPVMKKPCSHDLPKTLPTAPAAGAPSLQYRAGYVCTNSEQSFYRAVVGRPDKWCKWGGVCWPYKTGVVQAVPAVHRQLVVRRPSLSSGDGFAFFSLSSATASSHQFSNARMAV